MRRLVTVGGLLLAMVLPAGCAAAPVTPGAAATGASGSTATSSSIGAATAELRGSFTATSLTGHVLVPGSSIAMEFADGTIGARAGCNSIGGTFTVEAGQLVVGALTQTEMGCEQPLMDQDAWIVAFLGSAPTVTVSGDTISLVGPGPVAESIELQRAAAPREYALVGTRWVLDTIVEGEIASSVPAGVTPTVTVADGRIDLDAQCNAVGGAVVVADTDLTVTEVISTKMACQDARGEMEALLLAVFVGTVPYTVDANRLTVTGADGTQLVFTAAESAGGPETPLPEPLAGVTPVTPAPPMPPTT